MSIVDKVREAIKKKNSEGEEKENFKLSEFEETRIRDFEDRAGDMDKIMEKMEEADINTREVTAAIRNSVKDII